MTATAIPPAPQVEAAPLAAGLDVAATAEGIRLRLPDGGTTLLLKAGGKPFTLPEGSLALRHLALGADLGLLVLDEAGEPAAMLVGPGGVVLGPLEKLARQRDPATVAAVTAALQPILAGLFDAVRGPAVNDAAALLGGLDPALRGLLLAMYDSRGGAELPANLRLPHDSRRWFVAKRTEAALQLDPRLSVPSLQRGGRVLAARYLPLPQRRSIEAVVTWEEPALRYVALSMKFERRKVWFWWLPDQRRLLGGGLVDRAAKAAAIAVTTLLDTLLVLARPGERVALAETTRIGLAVTGHRHFGHAIFDEMQAIDRLVERRAEWTTPPVVYVIRNGSGLSLYGDPLDLYPDLAGLLVVMDSQIGLLRDALRRGVQIVPTTGRRALGATRRRLTALALRHGDAAGLAATAAARLGEGPSRPPCLVIGLRLTNRHPIDFEGFCLRLTRRLVAEFGRLVVILDGVNREPDTGNQAAQVVNGGAAAREGNGPLEAELAFAEAYAAAVAGLPVQVVNAVGLPIRDNLFWLSRADYFVAPNGAGLAKLRWALDVPGFVLTSQVTLEHCWWARLYADTDWMDPPFSPMHLTAPEEVQDVPPDPPRTAPPERTGTPFPDRFVLDEAKVIPRILGLFREALAAAGRAP